MKAEDIARVIAPHVGMWIDYDDLPKNHEEYLEWFAAGKCNRGTDTQEAMLSAAQAAMEAMK